MNPSLEPDSPPNPPPGGDGQTQLEGWKEFEQAYPGPILRQSKAQEVWSALTPDERALATRAAAGYAAWRLGERKPPNVLGAHLFLKERDAWPAYAGRPAAASRIVVKPDSPEGRAYRNLRRIGGAVQPLETRDGYSLPRALTPADMAFADLPPERDWPIIDDRQQIAAWLGFIADALPNTPRRQIVTEHKRADQTSVRGLKAPWPWPPTKDGRVNTGPPPDAIE